MKATNSIGKKGCFMKYSNNIWKAHDFVMAGRGEKHKVIEVAKHFKRCLVYSWQRIARGYADIDIWNMDMYLQELLPDMLQTLKDTRHGSPGCLGKNYVNEDGILVNDTCHAEWDRVLDRMIFLWRESSEETCSKKNPYERKHSEAYKKFSRRFGEFGEKLLTKEEKKGNKKDGSVRVHFMDELPEYREISEKYREAEDKLGKYRERCKDKAMDLMKKYFFYLWD